MKDSGVCAGLQGQVRFMQKKYGGSSHRWAYHRIDVCIAWSWDEEYEATSGSCICSFWDGQSREAIMQSLSDCCCLLLRHTWKKGHIMSCVKHGIAATRRRLWCLVALEDVGDLWNINKLQLTQTMLAKGDYVVFMGKAESTGREDVYRKIWTLLQLP